MLVDSIMFDPTGLELGIAAETGITGGILSVTGRIETTLGLCERQR